MIRLITISDIKKLINQIGIDNFFRQLIANMDKEFARWEHFQKSARHAIHVPNGVLELMPICDDEYYSFKYVNGHPNNPAVNKLTVAAVGLLADVNSGYPLMISEMTILTALRTAATSALAAKYLANKNTKHIGIIGTGAQSEFQVLAQHALFNLETVKYFDIDSHAMEKFAHNLKDQSFKLIPCVDAKSVLENVDIITTATADKKQSKILSSEWIHEGLHINGIGGDCPGKTELDQAILSKSKIVVEYLPQSKVEGEIQALKNETLYAELWELASGKKPGRESSNEITLFDSVGFALEDFVILKLVYELAQQHGVGQMVDMIPEMSDPKDLFGMLDLFF
jgi:ornithine cyclodeaminase